MSSSDAATSAGNTLQATYKCNTGYIPFTYTYTVAGASITGAAGCISCNGGTNTPTGYSTCTQPLPSLSTTLSNTITPGSITTQ